MISRFSKSATPSCSDEGSGLYPLPPADASGFDRGAELYGARGEQPIGQPPDSVISLRTIWLCAALIFVPAVLVASWYQYRVVGALQSQVTVAEARNLASKMDALIDARTSALRMAAGSIEIENLATSGGLNRLLGGLKDLFPDFRSLEILTEQGQPLAMMGELSLENVRKRAKLAKESNREPGLMAEPLFRDTPASDCFLITMKHQGPDGAVWFSRARFSREAVTSVLEPQRSDRNARLVSTQPLAAASEQAAPGSRAVPQSNEPDRKTFTDWTARSFLAQAALETPDWTVTLERKVPVSTLYCLSLLIGGLLAAGSALFLFRSKKSGNAPDTVYAAAVSETCPQAVEPEEHDEPLPETDGQDPDVSEAFAQALAEEAEADAEEAATAHAIPSMEESGGWLGAEEAVFSERADDDCQPDDATIGEQECCDPFVGLQEELGLTEEGADGIATDTLSSELEEMILHPDVAPEEAAVPDHVDFPVSEIQVDEEYVIIAESPVLLDEEYLITAEAVQQDDHDFPDTLEVCWTESGAEEVQPEEQSPVSGVNRGYSAV